MPDSEQKQKKQRRSFSSAKKKEIIELARQLGNTRIAFGEDDDVLQIEENEMNVNESDPNIVELLENFTFIDNEKCDGFEECDVEN